MSCMDEKKRLLMSLRVAEADLVRNLEGKMADHKMAGNLQDVARHTGIVLHCMMRMGGISPKVLDEMEEDQHRIRRKPGG